MVMVIDWAIMVFMPLIDGNCFSFQRMLNKVKDGLVLSVDWHMSRRVVQLMSQDRVYTALGVTVHRLGGGGTTISFSRGCPSQFEHRVASDRAPP